MKFKDFTGGMNTYDPPEDIGDVEVEELLNSCFDEGKLLRSRYGFTRVREATDVRKVYPFYVSGGLHLIYTASGGLYDNGTVLDASFTGAFSADEYGGMLYLANGTYYKRYDGTTLYNVGMEAPDPPTVTASAKSTMVIDNFDDAVVQYTKGSSPYNGGTAGAVARTAVAGEYFEGTAGIKITISEGSVIKAKRAVFTTAIDLTKFSDGGVSSEDDYITFRMKMSNPDHLRYLWVVLDVDDGSFDFNYFSSGRITKGASYGTNTDSHSTWLNLRYAIRSGTPFTNTNTNATSTPTYKDSGAVLPEGLPGEWVEFKMAKSDFEYQGTEAKKVWSAVKAVMFIIQANDDTDNSNLVVYIDGGELKGAAGADGGFHGRYYFCACYYNQDRDEYYEVSEESEAVDCDVATVDISAVPASFPDAQASHYVVWARKEDWANWFRIAVVAEGTTTETTGYDDKAIINNPEITEQTGMYPLPKMVSSTDVKTPRNTNNTPPPVPDFICIHRGKMFMIVDSAIYHSKSGQPWACPSNYWLEVTCTSDPVQGMYSDGANLSVHSKAFDFNYINAGDYDSMGVYMGYPAKARRSLGCVARHSIHSGIYASSLGISMFDGQDGVIMSDKVRRTYRAISGKANLHGVVYEDTYVLVNPGGNSIIMQRFGGGYRFYLWSLSSTARCCCVDAQSGLLYVGTDTGIYKYDTSRYTDSEGSFTFRIYSKLYEYAPEDTDAPVERATVKCNTGGNALTYDLQIDESGMGGNQGTLDNTVKTEEELHLDMGSVGSFAQIRMEGTVGENQPIRVYQIEIS